MKLIYSQLLLVFAFSCIIPRINSECTVEADSEKRALKLLEPLFGKTVTAKDEDEFSYNISFCTALDSSNAGVVQKRVDQSDKNFVIGRINETSIKNGTDWILLTYNDGDSYGSHCGHEKKQSHIFILCNPDTLIGKLSVLEENRNKSSDCYYLFEMESSVACVSKSPSSLGFGSVLLIIILVIAVVYLLVGVFYQRFVAQAKGIEQIPNLSFWRKIGGLSADGCNFVCRCEKSEEVRSYKGLGDDQLGMDEDEDRDENILPMY